MNVDWSCDRNKTRESAVNVILDRVHALFFPCNLVFLAVNVHRKRSVVKDFLDQCTIFPCFVTHSAVQISPQWRTIYLLLLLIQSSLLSSVHVWKRPRKQRVPNEIQASQAIKSMIKQKSTTKNWMLLSSQAVADTQTSQEFT